jgi:pimeloyl-ACP methyl ester carboxylesterase
LISSSAGGRGTWSLGSRHAEIWAALAPSDRVIEAGSALPLENLKQHNVPAYIVHGERDKSALARVMVAELKQLGVPPEYHEIPGGTHGGVLGPASPDIVEFFSRHQRADK